MKFIYKVIANLYLLIIGTGTQVPSKELHCSMKRYVSLERQIYNNFILINEGPNNTLKLIGIVSWNSKTPCGNTQVSRQTLHTEFDTFWYRI